jgi:hypothetical protein
MRGLVRFCNITNRNGLRYKEVSSILGKTESVIKANLTKEKRSAESENDQIFTKISQTTCSVTILALIKKLLQIGLSYTEIIHKTGLDPEQYFELDRTLKDMFVVYLVKSGERVVYIGEGTFERFLHATSGCSHVYGLNYLHFANAEVETTIVSLHKTKEAAVKEEEDLIKLHQPILNRRGNTTPSDVIYSLNAPITTKMLREAMVEYKAGTPVRWRNKRIVNPNFSYDDLLKRKLKNKNS